MAGLRSRSIIVRARNSLPTSYVFALISRFHKDLRNFATMTIKDKASPKTIELKLASANGLVTRNVLDCAPRDALRSEIPVIDISGIYSGSFAQRRAVACEIRDAATNTGFFYIKNHGIHDSVIESAYRGGLDFFRQQPSVKNKAKASGSDSFAGYFAPKAMKINPFEGQDVKEMFITRYNPEYDDSVETLAGVPDSIRASFRYQDTPWDGTSSVPQFKEGMVQYAKEGLKLTRLLMRAFALSLDLPEAYFDSKMQYPNINTNINYYPPLLSGDSATEGKPSSFGSHTDFQVITVLWQDNTGGLQVLNHRGQWINVPPIPGTFVVNIADLMQRLTNDVYVSTVHRAQNWSNRERISMTFATGFGNHETVEVVDTCVGPGNEKKYEDITVDEWVTKRLGNMIRLQRELDEQGS
ncbi:hypothetical protein Q7P35_006225 [Cladosporium inversicolor]